MSRLITPDDTGVERERHRRTIAEALHRLAAKRQMDTEALDLSALIVFSLRAVHQGVERSAEAWDKRHYYVKADRLRSDWDWCARYADRLARLIRAGDWQRLPVVLGDLAPHFADIRVARLTRSERLWRGAYERLVGQ
jgi:hypothetical protein